MNLEGFELTWMDCGDVMSLITDPEELDWLNDHTDDVYLEIAVNW